MVMSWVYTVVYDLGLHCLPRPHLWDARHEWVYHCVMATRNSVYKHTCIRPVLVKNMNILDLICKQMDTLLEN